LYVIIPLIFNCFSLSPLLTCFYIFCSSKQIHSTRRFWGRWDRGVAGREGRGWGQNSRGTGERWRWRLCTYNVTISRNKVKSHRWQQRLHWWMRGCSGSCVCEQEACCRRTDSRGRQEASADCNSEGSEDNNNKGDDESEGNDGEGNNGDDRNFPKRGGRQWTQQSTNY
jgi:hypothetical protein